MLQVRCKERLGGLVRCLASISGTYSQVPEGPDALAALAAQISSPPALAALLCGRGRAAGLNAGLDSEIEDDDVTVQQRVAVLTPVLELMIDAASGPPTFIRICYSILHFECLFVKISEFYVDGCLDFFCFIRCHRSSTC